MLSIALMTTDVSKLLNYVAEIKTTTAERAFIRGVWPVFLGEYPPQPGYSRCQRL
jgi:hypothetical protein